MSKKKHKKYLNWPRLTPWDGERFASEFMIAPVLRFSPTAWAKLLMFCHAGDTEIGGFGITSPDDPLRIEEFATIRQTVSAVTVGFDDDAVAEFFDAQVDAGRRPEQFARIWLHTHPGESPMPSNTDEQTFTRVFGACNWAVMFILAKGGATYARLRFNMPPAGQMRLPVEVQFTRSFPASDREAWKLEYEQTIFPEAFSLSPLPSLPPLSSLSSTPSTTIVQQPQAEAPRVAAATEAFGGLPGQAWDADCLMEHMKQMDVMERERFWDEVATRPELWGEDGLY